MTATLRRRTCRGPTSRRDLSLRGDRLDRPRRPSGFEAGNAIQGRRVQLFAFGEARRRNSLSVAEPRTDVLVALEALRFVVVVEDEHRVATPGECDEVRMLRAKDDDGSDRPKACADRGVLGGVAVETMVAVVDVVDDEEHTGGIGGDTKV